MPDQPVYLLEQARRCRSLALETFDQQAAKMLREMAIEYEARARVKARKMKAMSGQG